MAVASFDHKENCTLIESMHGKVKLIWRANANLMTLNFSNLEECLNYADKNQIQISIMYSGRRREERRGEGRKLPSQLTGRLEIQSRKGSSRKNIE